MSNDSENVFELQDVKNVSRIINKMLRPVRIYRQKMENIDNRRVKVMEFINEASNWVIERFSKHALQRAGQRRINVEDLTFVLKYGTEIHRTGVIFIFLRHRDIPDQLRHDSNLRKLEGTTVIISSDGEKVITVYRNRDAIRVIKRKLKRCQPKTKRTWH